MRTSALHTAIERLRVRSARQDGVFRRADALGAGLTSDEIRKLVQQGAWRSIQRGVYVESSTPATPFVKARAALLATNTVGAVVSHHTAARLLEIPLVHDSNVDHITLPGRGIYRPSRRDLRVHVRILSQADLEVVRGIPCTTVVRTLCDLLVDADQLTATWACEWALRFGMALQQDIKRRLAQEQQLPGGRRARIRLEFADPRSDSPLETAVRLMLVQGGLPTPVSQLSLVNSSGQEMYRLDLAYDEAKLAIETDGRAVHAAPMALFQDRRCQNDLMLLGWRILRFTWHDLTRRPVHIVATVRAALESSAARKLA